MTYVLVTLVNVTWEFSPGTTHMYDFHPQLHVLFTVCASATEISVGIAKLSLYSGNTERLGRMVLIHMSP